MKKETEEWLKIAMEDYKSAEYLFKSELYRMVCYHAQQTVEKVLKAILTEREVDFTRTHNVLDLRNAVERFGYVTGLTDEDSVFLNSVYKSRYPSDLGLIASGPPTKEDAEKVIRIANNILNGVKIFFGRSLE